MYKLTIVRVSGLCAIFALGAAACGSDKPSATAEPGSKFCKLAQEARDIGDDVDTAEPDPDVFRQQVGAALKASKKAAAAAPKDFKDLAKESVGFQEDFIKILEEYDYVVLDALTSDEGQELFEQPRYAEVQDERNAYLLDNCEIERTDNTDGDIPLSPGEDGIRQLFELLQLNESFNITDDQIDCAVDALAGNISDEDLNAIADNQPVSDEGTQKFELAVSTCEIEIPGS